MERVQDGEKGMTHGLARPLMNDNIWGGRSHLNFAAASMLFEKTIVGREPMKQKVKNKMAQLFTQKAAIVKRAKNSIIKQEVVHQSMADRQLAALPHSRSNDNMECKASRL